jgi:hypothetical protein
MVVSESKGVHMLWFLLFLISILWTMVAIIAVILWLGVVAAQSLLTCAERSLTSFADGHAILGLLYLVPAALFVYALGDGLYLAFSFCQAVIR